MTRRYEINEQDIDATIRYLQNVDPENATPETAIAFLEELQSSVHMLAHENPELLEKTYGEVKNKKKIQE